MSRLVERLVGRPLTDEEKLPAGVVLTLPFMVFDGAVAIVAGSLARLGAAAAPLRRLVGFLVGCRRRGPLNRLYSNENVPRNVGEWLAVSALEGAQRAAEIAHEAVPAHPSITNHAASLERHGEVGSRLHQSAAVYEQRRELLRTQQLLEEMAPFEPGWAPFEPYGEGGAEETMDERAQRSAARREERLKEATPQYPFTPALNARGRVLISYLSLSQLI